jgi:hypothetical protein
MLIPVRLCRQQQQTQFLRKSNDYVNIFLRRDTRQHEQIDRQCHKEIQEIILHWGIVGLVIGVLDKKGLMSL